LAICNRRRTCWYVQAAHVCCSKDGSTPSLSTRTALCCDLRPGKLCLPTLRSYRLTGGSAIREVDMQIRCKAVSMLAHLNTPAPCPAIQCELQTNLPCAGPQTRASKRWQWPVRECTTPQEEGAGGAGRQRAARARRGANSREPGAQRNFMVAAGAACKRPVDSLLVRTHALYVQSWYFTHHNSL